MDTKRALAVHSTKIVGTVLIGYALILIFILTKSYNVILDLKQDSVSKRLLAITSTIVPQIDATKLDALLTTQLNKDAVTKNTENEIYAEIHQILSETARRNNLSTPIYTLTRNTNNNNSFFFGVTSAADPYFRHPYSSDNAAYQQFYCLLYTSPSPRDKRQSRMPSSA